MGIQLSEKHFSHAAVRQFAEYIQIHPGIVVGRLQYDKHLLPSHLNGLKEKFRWTNAT